MFGVANSRGPDGDYIVRLNRGFTCESIRGGLNRPSLCSVRSRTTSDESVWRRSFALVLRRRISGHSEVRACVSSHYGPVIWCVFLQFGATVCLGLFCVCTVSRLQFLGIRAAGVWIALLGGLLTVANGMGASLAAWTWFGPSWLNTVTCGWPVLSLICVGRTRVRNPHRTLHGRSVCGCGANTNEPEMAGCFRSCARGRW
jgi:hypothetical protein